MEKNNPELLHKYTSTHTSQGASNIFRDINIKEKLTWKANETILDVGCGPGDLVCNVLPKFIPADSNITAADVSVKQINFAKKQYSNRGIAFDIMDITDNNLWTKWKEKSYDKIFCTYVMHGIHNDRKAYENMYNLLKPGGEIVLIFTIKSSVDKIAAHLAKLPKYRDYAEKLSKMQFHVKPQDDYYGYFNDLFKSVGFEVTLCKLRIHRQPLTSPNDAVEVLLLATSLTNIIPGNLIEDALQDALRCVHDNPILEEVDNIYHIHYTHIILIAKKPF